MQLSKAIDAVYRRVWSGTRGEHTAMSNAHAALEFFGDVHLRNLTAAKIDGFVAHLHTKGNSDATINRKLAALSKILKFAVARGWIEKVPTIERLEESMGRIRWLTDSEQQILVSTISNKHHDYGYLILFLANTGLRVGEALALQWKDIHGEGTRTSVTIHETKNNHPRTVPLNLVAAQVISMFTVSMGSPITKGPFLHLTQSGLTRFWNETKEEMGLKEDKEFVPHCLRHTFCSRLVQRGVDLLQVKQLAGHKALTTTLRYAHLAPKNLVDAVAALDK